VPGKKPVNWLSLIHFIVTYGYVCITVYIVVVLRDNQSTTDHFDDPSLVQNLRENHVSVLCCLP